MIDISKSLFDCLNAFNGAGEAERKDEKENNLFSSFVLLAKKMIYGGYFRVRKDYAIFISKVEFYYHEEEGAKGEKMLDPIVYHRNGRFGDWNVPYFPVMTLHSHWSGFDITFEKESSHYRASALIRNYVVMDLKSGKYLELDTSVAVPGQKMVGRISRKDDPVIDSRSTYLQFFLNGFSFGGEPSDVKWEDLDIVDGSRVKNECRQHAEDHKWGFIYLDYHEYLSFHRMAKDCAMKRAK